MFKQVDNLEQFLSFWVGVFLLIGKNCIIFPISGAARSSQGGERGPGEPRSCLAIRGRGWRPPSRLHRSLEDKIKILRFSS